MTPFRDVLAGVDAGALERAWLSWQEQLLGPVQDAVVIVDGKTLRHAPVELVSGVTGTGRWLGTVAVPAGSNEIPAARNLLAKVGIQGKTALADALPTPPETGPQTLLEDRGDYLLTVKGNQNALGQTLATWLTPGAFSPRPTPQTRARKIECRFSFVLVFPSCATADPHNRTPPQSLLLNFHHAVKSLIAGA